MQEHFPHSFFERSINLAMVISANCQQTMVKITDPKYFLVFSMLLISCNSDSNSNYFPLAKGITWTYNIEQLTLTEPIYYRMIATSLGKQKVKDKDMYVRKLHNDKYQYFNVDEKGLYERIATDNPTVFNNRYLYRYPLTHENGWEADGDPFLMRKSIDEINAQQNSMPGLQQDSPLKMTYHIESLSETVKVPAGKFHNCLKIVGRGTCTFSTTRSFAKKMPVDVINKEWYCPGVGLVKVERHETSERVSLKPVHYRVELEKFVQ